MPEWREYVRRHLPKTGVRAEREAEIVSELALQLEQAYTDALARGVPEPEARHIAEAQIADWQGLAWEIRDAEQPVRAPSRERWGSGIVYDIRHTLHWLRRSPLFTAAMIGTLALGIAGNTTIFTMVDAVALRSLPYRDPGRLVAIDTTQPRQPEIAPNASAPDFYDFRERTRSFESVASISPVWSLVMTGRGDTERLECLFVSADFFPMLGVQPELGRVFTHAED